MRVEKRDGSTERRILIGMVVDSSLLGRLSAKWEPGLFKSTWANVVAGWCVEFYNRYGEAPAGAVEGLFESWAENADKETVKLVERFLEGLSDEYESLAKDSNSDYLLDLAGEHFNKVKLSRLAEEIQGDIDNGNASKALKRVVKYTQVEVGIGAGIDVLHDPQAMKDAFTSKDEVLIQYPGALGRFFGPHLQRDGFIVFQGPEKRGKTWWLLDLAWRALLQRRRVAFFEIGDMSQNQIMRRFMIRAAKRPLTPKKVQYPMSISREEDEQFATSTLSEREWDDELSWQEALAACEKVMHKNVKSKDRLLRLSCHPNSTIGVAGITSILQGWERDGWGSPDVVVIDYADLLAPMPGYNDSRDQVNAAWKQLRAMSQSLHCLVVTATQADAASYRTETITMHNFSEDKRKNAHVTGMVGLNQTPQEKEQQIMRLNWIVLREGDFHPMKCVHVAGCLSVGNPAVKSTF